MKDTTLVLVHGAWTGAWIWDRVRPLLEDSGHPVFTPTLRGLGERAGEIDESIDLQTHVRELAENLESRDAERIVLVGHGYAGLLLAALAQRLPRRLEHLIYLDAFVPQKGEALIDFLEPEQVRRLQQEASALPPPEPRCLGVEDEGDARWMESRLTPQPRRTFFQRSEPPTDSGIARSFVRCQDPALPSLEGSAVVARREGWRFQVLSTGHCPQISAPYQVADLLLELDRRGFQP